MRAASAIPLICALAVALPALSAPSQGPAKEKDQDKEVKFDESLLDEKILSDARLGVDGPSLLKYFRDRTHKETDPKQVEKLIQQLGDAKFAIREKAFAELLVLGNSALAAVKEAANHNDQEVRMRAIELRRRIEERANPTVQAAVARLIGHRKPEGAAEVLLAYVPFAADEWVVDEIALALAKVAMPGGKVDEALVKALSSKHNVQRALAGAALAAAGAKDQLAAVRGLLKDASPEVRLRAAHALVLHAADADAMRVMIGCFRDVPAEKAGPAEELLLRIAGDKAPRVTLGDSEASRKQYFEEWDKWWQENQKAVDLAKIDLSKSLMGYTLVVYQNQAGAGVGPGGTVMELDAAKHVRWKFSVPNFCSFAQVLGPNRVLVVERNNNCVTERDFNGNIRSQINANGPVIAAQRLPNGNTFIVMQNMLAEYDVKGKEVYSFVPPKLAVYRGRKMANGDVVYITSVGDVTRLDSKTNNVISSFKIGTLGNIYGTLQELPNGNLLLPLYTKKMAIEVDPTGKEVWSMQFPQNPYSATRLPNGNLLVSFLTNVNFNLQIVEYDRNQREVWSHKVEGTAFVVSKR